jgi:hypothetical protein
MILGFTFSQKKQLSDHVGKVDLSLNILKIICILSYLVYICSFFPFLGSFGVLGF